MESHFRTPRDVDRSAMEFLVLVLSGAVLVLDCGLMTEPIFDHEKLDVDRVLIEYVGASYGIAKTLGRGF